MSEKHWVPEIMYEEAGDELSSNIPFIQVPSSEKMPGILFIFESRESGDFEPGPEGEEIPVVELDLHQYADMGSLKRGLDPLTYDLVRSALGLEPLTDAVEKGQRITESIRQKIKSQ